MASLALMAASSNLGVDLGTGGMSRLSLGKPWVRAVGGQ